MRQYIALIHKDPDSDYGVSFPDLPGCISAGETLDEARTMAEEALAFHLEGLAEDGEAVPEPSSLEAVMADRENRDAVAILVPVKTAAPKVVRLNITMQEDVLARIDAFAESKGMNRSGFLAHAATREIQAASEHVTRFADITAWERTRPSSLQEETARHDAVRSVGRRMAQLVEKGRAQAIDYTEFEALFRELHTLGSTLPNSMVQAVADAFVAEERTRSVPA